MKIGDFSLINYELIVSMLIFSIFLIYQSSFMIFASYFFQDFYIQYFKITMLKTFLSQLESRVQSIQKLIGPTSEYSQKQVRDIRDGITDFSAKLPKDISRKFDRIKKDIEKYHVVIDTIPINDKLTLVHSQIQELHTIATQLTQIQKLLPALNTDNYLKFREEYKNQYLFSSASELQQSVADKIAVKKESAQSLMQVRAQHRKAMNEVLELNGQIVKNLSLKLQALQNKRSKGAAI